MARFLLLKPLLMRIKSTGLNSEQLNLVTVTVLKILRSKRKTKVSDLSTRRELKLMRERRLLRQSHGEEKQSLRYHFMGVLFNCGLVTISLLLILCIGRSKGLCIKDMEVPSLFKKNQLDMCYDIRKILDDCQGSSGVCEICSDDGTSQCYYPYY